MKMKKIDNINIIPFVDIMLVLLAIVLTTSTLIEKNMINVSLPKANASKKLNQKSITITIKKNGDIFFENTKISKDILGQKLFDLKKNDLININCDKNAKFDDFIYVLDLLKTKGFENIFIVTLKNE